MQEAEKGRGAVAVHSDQHQYLQYSYPPRLCHYCKVVIRSHKYQLYVVVTSTH